MNGLELSRRYYEEYGKPMLEREFAKVLPYLAVGFVGRGSDRFGFDDAVSTDHDFEPGFCIFLPDEQTVDRRTAFLLERAYDKLPKEYGGVQRQRISPVGGNRNGVLRTADFYQNLAGTPDGNLSLNDWLYIPDYALAEATNGAVFWDAYGEFSRIRETLCHMPSDAKRKRIAGNLLLMAQAGQYNVARCLRHGEPQAAQLACDAFVTATMRVWFLLSGRYMPYYKWGFRALKEIADASFVQTLSEALCCDVRTEAARIGKQEAIEAACRATVEKVRKAGWDDSTGDDLERLAYAVNDTIRDPTVRNLHILTAV